MSNEYITAVLESDVESQSQFAVLMVLADMANKNGQCWPHLDTLARLSRAGRSTVSAALSELEKGGYLAKRRRRGDSSVYTLSMERLTRKSNNQNIQDLEEPDAGSSSSEAPKVQDLDGSKENPHEPSIRPKRSKRSGPSKPKPKAEEHPDARKLCDRLVELMVINDCKKPTISKAWLDAARLLLTKDGRAFDDALAVLEWSQADSFWKGNIESMPTFRDRYDRLRLQAEGRGELKKPGPRLRTDDEVREWLNGEWRAGRTSEVEDRTGLRYQTPDLPIDLRGADAAAAFYAEQARAWITNHRDEIFARITRKATTAA